MKYEFVLTDKMKEDRFMCGKDDNICEECSCRMGNSDCIFNHLYVTAEQEYDVEEDFDPETRTVKYTVKQKQIRSEESLDKAIKHAEEVVEEYNKCAEYIRNKMKSEIALSNATKYEACAKEHRQLAEWLKDYKRLLEESEVEE